MSKARRRKPKAGAIEVAGFTNPAASIFVTE